MDKKLRVLVSAEIGAFIKDMDRVSAKAKETAKKTEDAGAQSQSGIGRLADVANQHEKAWGQVANTMVGAGTAITGGLVLSAKAAMDWQSQFAGVRKTIDDTEEGYAELSDGLRDLAKELPSTHAEIAGVAEAAGQLGVARDDVLGFTATMIDLGETTNLTAEDAATYIAQISNVMGTMEREGAQGVERFGSALVALGNDGASTEAEILSMAQRIAGAAASLGASEADVLALSNTLASMGVRSELGGGVATRVLLKMRTAVDESGESLEAFAGVAGTSAEEFASKFSSSPMEALQDVAEGIARTNDAGGNLTATLKDMGIKGTEEMQVMLALANSGDLLTESLELGSKAWEENSALADEAAQRYATAESKVKVAWNNIKDAGIDAGAVLLPVIASMAEGVADLVGWFTDLPAPVQGAVTILATVAGVGALAAGAFMKIVPGVVETVTGLRDLIKEGPKSVGSMSKMEKGALGVAAAYTAIAAAAALASDSRRKFDKQIESSEIVNALDGIAGKSDEAYAALDKVFNGSVVTGGGSGIGGAPTAVNDLATAMDRLFNTSGFDNFNDFLGTWLPGVESGSEVVRENMREMDAALVELTSGGKIDDAAAGFGRVMAAATERGADVKDVMDMFPQYRDAAYEALTANDETQVSQERLVEAMLKGLPAGEAAAEGTNTAKTAYENAAKTAQEAADAVDEWYDSLVNSGMVIIGENEAIRRLQESINSATMTIKENGEVVDKNGEAFDRTSDKYLASSSALDGIASSTLAVIDPMREAGATTAEMSEELAHGRENFIKQATAMGYSKEAAAAYADQLGLLPGSVYVQFNSNTDLLAGKLTEIHELVQSTPDGNVTITENSPEVRAALETLGYILTELPDGRIEVSETGTDETGKKIDETAAKKRVAKINAQAITGAAEEALKNAARTRFATIAVSTRFTDSGASAVHRGGTGGLTGNYRGGQISLPGYEDGGKLPRTGLGRDMILGVTSEGRPIANVDDEEWIIRKSSANKYNRVLGAINADDPSVQHLASFAGGGRASSLAAMGGGSAGTVINIGDINVNGAGDAMRAAQAVEDRITNKLAKVGMRIG
ncbi:MULTISPECIES: phage tail tape measure protein [unclassified Glutamicibacter]|uniref:phage tail tape measure protein n=1 Tax=unclassified Glutamicibacter TaxID=2627139 RepID=UPI00382D8908